MLVKASEGLRCPMESNSRRYITDSVAVTVIKSTYYKRLVRDGSLLLVTEKATATKKATTTKKTKPKVKETEK